jgi:hypothetical protein
VLIVLVAVFALVLLTVAACGVGGTPAVTPGP